MKTFVAISLFVATLITTTMPANAADRSGAFIAFGRGLRPCGAQLTSTGLHLDAIIWLAGFMSSFNAYQPDTYDITAGASGWDTWVEEYCRLNPAQDLADAAKAFVTTSYGTRHTIKLPTVTPPARQPNLAKTRGLTRDRNQY